MIEVEVEKLIWRGRGLGRIKGGKRAIILPPVLPGEVIRGEIVREKKDYVEIRPKLILKNSPHRISHPCAYADRCGGCSFGFIEKKEQISLKKTLLLQELNRGLSCFLKEPLDTPLKVYCSPQRWEYRWRGQVFVESGHPHFKELASHRLIPFDKCLLFSTPINESLNPICKRLPRGKIIVAASPIDSKVYTNRDKGPLLLPLTGFSYPLKIHPSCFFQANQALNTELVEWVVREVEEYHRIIDLFSGSGNFALLLIHKGKEVILVEKDPLAIEAALQFSREYGLDLIVERRDLFKADLSDILHNYNPHAVIVDPPRIGGKKVALELASYNILKKIIWISCDIVNTSRDISVLLKKDWNIKKIALFDMFPQTYHMEVVFVLIKEKMR